MQNLSKFFRVLCMTAIVAVVASGLAYAAEAGFSQEGLAGMYDHQGKTTTLGEPFDKAKPTAAHPFLPLGATLKLTNLENKKTVEVRVTDRGPDTAGRAIDISPAAAKALDMAKGKAKVRIEPVGPLAGAKGADLTGLFFVQLGAFSMDANAKKLYDALKAKGQKRRLVQVTTDEKQIAKVQAGPYELYSLAQKALQDLSKDYKDAFILADPLDLN